MVVVPAFTRVSSATSGLLRLSSPVAKRRLPHRWATLFTSRVAWVSSTVDTK